MNNDLNVTVEEQTLVLSDFYNKHFLGFYFSGIKLQKIENLNDNSIVGNIYCGYVKDIVKNINAAFIEFDIGNKGYYSLTDNNPFFLNNKNNDKVNQGDVILVQVSSDQIKSKEYTLTSKISLTGKFCVLTVGNNNISISKKISENSRRTRLKNLFEKYENTEFGFIARTSCCADSNIDEEDLDILIENEIKKLINMFENIKQKSKFLTSKSLVYKSEDTLIHACKEFEAKFKCPRIISDDKAVVDKLIENKINADFYNNNQISLHSLYSLEKRINEALSKKVWLKSGAYLVIETTEALTVIDVNTGKAELKTNRQKTFSKINSEAAHEIMRQLKIRNISGIIIIDFISMESIEEKNNLIQTMEHLAKYDYTKCSIMGITKLGLMELTRKKETKPIYEFLK